MAASSDVDDLTEQQHVVNDSPFDRQNSDVRFINISIKCYEKKTGSGFKEEYYAYKIISIVAPHNDYEEDDEHASGNRSRYEVWRRYSEFEYLRNFMLTVYPHVVIPPIPEKALRGSVSLLNKMAITNEDTDFLLQRQHALEIFLVRISRHPTLCKNVWFHKFCEEAVWKEQLLQSGFIPKTNSMFQSLSLQLSKRVPDSRFQEVKQYANDVESIFKAILEIREKMNTSLMSIYKVHTNYGRVFSEMSAIEDKLGIPMQVCSGCLDSYADSIDNFFVEEETRFYLPLKEYIGFCDSLKTVVRRHELLQNQLEKMEETVSSKAEARNVIINSNPETSGGQRGKRFTFKNISARLRGEDTSYEGQLAISEKELQDSEVQLCDHQKKFDDFNENAIVELEKFNLQKFGDFRSMLVNYVQLQMHIHKKGTATWQKVKEAFNEIET